MEAHPKLNKWGIKLHESWLPFARKSHPPHNIYKFMENTEIMGDYLDTKVVSCEIGSDSTHLVLDEKAALGTLTFQGLQFNLPFALKLQLGDRIEFYMGAVTVATSGRVTISGILHDNYVRATVYRGRGFARTPILSFEGKQMQGLEEIKEAALYI